MATALLGVALGAAGVLGIGSFDLLEPPPRPVVEPAAGARLAVALEDPIPNPEDLPRIPPEGLLPPEAESHPEHFAADESPPPEAPEPLPAEIAYRRLEKLSAESAVPHRTVGAWDEEPDAATPGVRRAFVVVVEPGLPDAALETLARDLRAQHRDARVLSVRIFDSEEGARRAGWVDGGALAHRHLVAQVHRNEALDLDTIRVRGRRIEP